MRATSTQFDLCHASLGAGTTLIEASAGTGKTYNIAGLFLRLILERGLTANQILAVTYTEAATKELRDRIQRRLAEALAVLEGKAKADGLLTALLRKIGGAERAASVARLQLRLALAEFDTAPIYTIHGFCQRVLADRAFECGRPFELELAPDENDLLHRVARDFWRRKVVPDLLVTAVLNGKSLRIGAAKKGAASGPDALVSLLSTSRNHADLEVLGGDLRSLADVRAELAAAREALVQCWPAIEAAMTTYLGDAATGLSSAIGKYQVDREVPRYLESMRAIVSGQFSQSQFADLEMFLITSLEDKAKKNFQRPVGNVAAYFQCCAVLWEAAERFTNAVQEDFIRHAQVALPQMKRREGVLGFAELLTELDAALAGEGGEELAARVRQQYSVALIDEFQDTDPVQCRIFQRLFQSEGSENGETALFLIGDPKQSIYSFRGADVFSYLHAAQRAGSKATLRDNYRSEPALIAAVNRLFQNRDAHDARPFWHQQIGFEAAASPASYTKPKLENVGQLSPLQLWCWPGTQKGAGPLGQPTREGAGRVGVGLANEHLPEVVAAAIVDLLEGGEVLLHHDGRREELRPEHIAVLVRTNRQARAVKEALVRRRVPAVLKTSENVYHSREATDLARLLDALATPHNMGAIKLALATDLLGCNASELIACTGDEAKQGEAAQEFSDYRECLAHNGFLAMLRQLLARRDVRERLLQMADGERRLTNLFHLGELLHHVVAEQRLGPAALSRWLQRQQQDDRDGNEESQLRLESDENAVRIVTIHRSKGLEYPIVFLPYAWDRRDTPEKGFSFHPDPANRPGCVQLELGSPQVAAHRNTAIEENLADQLRLLYVGLTRAKNRCYVVTGRMGLPKKGRDEIPGIGWLLHPEVYKEADATQASLDDARMWADCQQVAATSLDVKTNAPTIQASLLPSAHTRAWSGLGGETPHGLQALAFDGRIQPAWGVQAFSSLVKGKETVAAMDAEELPDRDATSLPIVDEGASAGIHLFPAGAAPGNCLHEIFEHLDFCAAARGDANALRGITSTLAKYGYAQHEDAVREHVHTLLATPLRAQGDCVLGQLERGDRLAELEFTFPMHSVSPEQLAKIFAEHPSPAMDAGFPARIGRLPFQTLKGFMRGFMDLAFRQQGRFYLLDWKSNKLGASAAAYTPAALRAAMESQLYYLQYHLYTLALDQYLRLRQPGYDYERDFGGVFYVFNRGILRSQPGHGVFHDRPSRALMAALATAFGLEQHP